MCVSLAPKRCRPVYVVQGSHDSSSNQYPDHYSRLFLKRLTSRMRVRLLPELQQPMTDGPLLSKTPTESRTTENDTCQSADSEPRPAMLHPPSSYATLLCGCSIDSGPAILHLPFSYAAILRKRCSSSSQRSLTRSH